MRHPRWFAVWLVALLAALAVPPAGAQTPQTPRAELVQARRLYNQGQYAAALTAATAAATAPSLRSRALLVEGRAHLEQFRRTGAAADLTAARTAFQTLDPANLDAADRLQLLIGLAESLYVGQRYGAAADLFAVALDSPAPIAAADHDALLDWWASALQHEATLRARPRAEALYRRIADRMRVERRVDPQSVVAAYWVVAAARGRGDLAAAWDEAIATWVRAPLMGSQATTLRADIDHLMITGIIPDRARQLATSPSDAAATAADLRAEWDVVKKTWGEN